MNRRLTAKSIIGEAMRANPKLSGMEFPISAANDDKQMLKIAHDYMKLMGIENTQFIIARHIDRDHPHYHIVYNRVDNDGRTISDRNGRFCNEKVCKMLTARYQLHFSEGKENINTKRVVSVPACSTSQLLLPPIPKRRCWQSNM